MKEILDFLAGCKQFFLATNEGFQPRVRPMALAFEYKGKLSFTTSNTKKMFAQLKANPNIEICASNRGKWLRITGAVGFNAERDAKVKAMEIDPSLGEIHELDDGIFEVFHLERATAVFEDMQGHKTEIKL
jgi:uncharacterized pyridoxamine 5'-phosphate oxidase family protein